MASSKERLFVFWSKSDAIGAKQRGDTSTEIFIIKPYVVLGMRHFLCAKNTAQCAGDIVYLGHIIAHT